MEQKEVLNDITFVTDHLHSSDLNADISQVNRGAQARACFENIGYEFSKLFQKIEELETMQIQESAVLFQKIEELETKTEELETQVSDLTDNLDSFATEDYVDEALDKNLNDKIQDKLSEAKLQVQVVF